MDNKTLVPEVAVSNATDYIGQLVIIMHATGKFQPFVTLDSSATTKMFGKALTEVSGMKVMATSSSCNDSDLIKSLQAKGVRVAVSKK